MTWTTFWDMHSGGDRKLSAERIYIEASEDEAKSVFYARFDRNPERVSCTCCGKDYSISESPTLAEASAYERGCAWDKDGRKYVERPSDDYRGRSYMSLDDYLASGSCIVIRADEITSAERTCDVPEEGYVWR